MANSAEGESLEIGFNRWVLTGGGWVQDTNSPTPSAWVWVSIDFSLYLTSNYLPLSKLSRMSTTDHLR